MDMTMPPEIVADERARAMAAIDCWLRRDQEGFDAVVGSDEECAILLPIVIGELATAIEHLTRDKPGSFRREVSAWLDEHRRRLAG